GCQRMFVCEREDVHWSVSAGQRTQMGCARDLDIEVARGHAVAELLCKQPVARELPADHRIDARCPVHPMVDDLVIAGKCILGRAVLVKGGPYTCICADGTRAANARKRARYPLNEIANLLARRSHIVKVAVVVIVGGPNQAHVLPWVEEDLPAI